MEPPGVVMPSLALREMGSSIMPCPSALPQSIPIATIASVLPAVRSIIGYYMERAARRRMRPKARAHHGPCSEEKLPHAVKTSLARRPPCKGRTSQLKLRNHRRACALPGIELHLTRPVYPGIAIESTTDAELTAAGPP